MDEGKLSYRRKETRVVECPPCALCCVRCVVSFCYNLSETDGYVRDGYDKLPFAGSPMSSSAPFI